MNEQINLIDRALKGVLTAPELVSFQRSLKRDPRLRQDYYETLATELLLAKKFGKNARMEQAIRSGRSRPKRLSVSPRLLFISSAAALVLVTAFLTVLYFINSKYEPPTFVLTADSHVLIDGSVAASRILKPGQKLSIRQGTVSINLNQSTQAMITAPAVVRLRDKDGNLDLLSGAAYFEVNGKEGSNGITVHAAGRIVRDIGTKFGVVVEDSRVGEVHVFSGSISISEGDTEKEDMVPSDNAASWSKKAGVGEIPLNEDKFIKYLPESTVLLADDFNDPDGTPINGKSADVGSSWTVTARFDPRAVASTVVGAGKYDSSFNARQISASFVDSPLTAAESAVYAGDFHLLPPVNAGKQVGEPNGKVQITFYDTDGKPLLSLVSAVAENGRWYLADEMTGKRSAILEASKRPPLLTFVYDSRDGKATLRQLSEGSSLSQVELPMGQGLSFGSVSIGNAGGADLAIDSLRVERITYPKKSSGAD